MSWEEGVVARLKTASNVAALAGDRVEWDDLEPDSAYPAIMMQTIFDAQPQNNDDFDGFWWSRVQVNCLARTKTEAVALRKAAIRALVPPGEAAGTQFLQSFVEGGGSVSGRTPTGRLIQEHADLIIWHN